MDEERICRTCDTSKPLSDYYDNNNRGTYVDCKVCVISQRRLHKHGLSQEDYDRMLEDQERSCSICLLTIEEYREKYTRFKNFHVDHCHSSGRIRGLLCHNCNRAIGMLQDCSENLRRAVEYLETR